MSCNPTATLSGSDAIRLFHAGTLRYAGGMRSDGLSVLQEPQDGGSMDIWGIGPAFPANL